MPWLLKVIRHGNRFRWGILGGFDIKQREILKNDFFVGLKEKEHDFSLKVRRSMKEKLDLSDWKSILHTWTFRASQVLTPVYSIGL